MASFSRHRRNGLLAGPNLYLTTPAMEVSVIVDLNTCAAKRNVGIRIDVG